MSFTSSENFESFVPVYDAIPDKWEDARPFLVETLKQMSNGINLREIGWFLDEELLSGKAFIPGVIAPGNTTPPQFRQILRKVVDCSPLIAGVNSFAHGIIFDVNFTLIDMWVAATNSTGFTAINMSDPQNVTLDATNINITSPGAYDRAFAVIEYIQEL